MADDAADRAADRAAHRRGRRLGLRSGLALLGGWFGVVWKVLAVPPSLTDPEPRPGERFGVTLARMAPPDIDPAGHLVSEKYDGVRAVWDGRALRTRHGQIIQAPAAFLARLPAQVPLDGELWLGRGHGRFDAVSALVRRRRPVEADWAQVVYLIFELPRGGGRFDERVARLVEIVAQQDAEFKELGLSVTESILEAHPETQIVWCWNQGALLGSLAALKANPKAKVLLMGTDMSIDLARAMLEPNSFLVAVTTQQPFEIGYTSVKNAYDLATTGKAQNEVLVPLKTYKLDDKADIQKYLDDRKNLIK